MLRNKGIRWSKFKRIWRQRQINFQKSAFITGQWQCNHLTIHQCKKPKSNNLTNLWSKPIFKGAITPIIKKTNTQNSTRILVLLSYTPYVLLLRSYLSKHLSSIINKACVTSDEERFFFRHIISFHLTYISYTTTLKKNNPLKIHCYS